MLLLDLDLLYFASSVSRGPYRADRFLKLWQPEGTFSKDLPNAVVYLDGKHAIITITNVERQGQYLIASIQPDTKNSPDTLSVTDDAYLGMVIDNASTSHCGLSRCE